MRRTWLAEVHKTDTTTSTYPLPTLHQPHVHVWLSLYGVACFSVESSGPEMACAWWGKELDVVGRIQSGRKMNINIVNHKYIYTYTFPSILLLFGISVVVANIAARPTVSLWFSFGALPLLSSQQLYVGKYVCRWQVLQGTEKESLSFVVLRLVMLFWCVAFLPRVLSGSRKWLFAC